MSGLLYHTDNRCRCMYQVTSRLILATSKRCPLHGSLNYMAGPQCGRATCVHPTEAHAGKNGACSICGCPRFIK